MSTMHHPAPDGFAIRAAARRATPARMKRWELVWSPSASIIAVVDARTPRAAVRQAPMPWRRFLGEIFAREI